MRFRYGVPRVKLQLHLRVLRRAEQAGDGELHVVGVRERTRARAGVDQPRENADAVHGGAGLAAQQLHRSTPAAEDLKLG